ncbi:hypothetical protein ACF0H5_011893 [Mactra antiquata]
MGISDYLKLILLYVHVFYIGLYCENIQTSEKAISWTTTLPVVSTDSASDSKETNTYRLPLDELTQTYFQYNQYCGHSCVLNTYQTGQISCCEECSCDLDNCNNITTQSTCCPDLLNKLQVYPRNYQKCIHPLAFSWKSGQPLPNATLMVVSCPSDTDITLVEKCENRLKSTSIEYKTPYSLLDPLTNSLFIYRNKYCLSCWHDPEVVNKATRWRLSVICSRGKIYIEEFDEDTLIRGVKDNDNCSLVFMSPTKLPSVVTCGQGISECNITGKWHRSDATTATVCQAFRAPFRNIYRNLFCYICNTGDDISSSSFTNCDQDQKVNISFIMMTSLYLNPSPSENQPLKYIENIECLEDEIQDRMQNKCLPIKCRFYKVFDTTSNKCKPLVEVIGGLKLVIVMKLLPSSGNCKLSALPEVTVRDFVGRMFTRMTNTSGVLSGIFVYRRGNGTLCDSQSSKDYFINDFEYFVVSIKIHYPVKECCSEMGKLPDIEIFVTSLHGKKIVIVKNGSSYKFKVIIDGSVANTNNTSEETDFVESGNVTDDLRTLHVTDTCPGVKLHLADYNVTYDSNGLFINSFHIYNSDLIFSNDTNDILICVHTFKRFQGYFLPPQVSCASCLRTFGLILHILVLVVFKYTF